MQAPFRYLMYHRHIGFDNESAVMQIPSDYPGHAIIHETTKEGNSVRTIACDLNGWATFYAVVNSQNKAVADVVEQKFPEALTAAIAFYTPVKNIPFEDITRLKAEIQSCIETFVKEHHLSIKDVDMSMALIIQKGCIFMIDVGQGRGIIFNSGKDIFYQTTPQDDIVIAPFFLPVSLPGIKQYYLLLSTNEWPRQEIIEGLLTKPKYNPDYFVQLMKTQSDDTNRALIFAFL